jgi:GH25 family lysozyme M1 (1,4-beta-N-acetylmuramidase)
MTYTLGIDTSTFQDSSQTAKVIDWTKPKLYGVKFVINRVTFCATPDDDFRTNWQAEKEQGYLRGAYGFWGYWSGAPAVDVQARAVVEALRGDPGEMPVVWADVEKASNLYAELPPRAVALPMLERYMKGIEDGLGRGTGIYTNLSGILRLSPIPQWLLDRPLWLAWPLSPSTGESVEAYIERTKIRPPLKQWPAFRFWQYSWKGPGLAMGMESHGLDMNYFNGTADELAAWCKPAPAAPTLEERVKALEDWRASFAPVAPRS